MNEDLKQAFGNHLWTAGDLYRAVMLDTAEHCENVLECGSGLTSLDLARAGVSGVALEHMPEWIVRVEEVAAKHDINWDTFKVLDTGLVDFGDYHWYHYQDDLMFDLVVCDGPPRTTKGSRYGLLPQMSGNLNPGCLILFDDYMADVATSEIVFPWHAQYGVRLLDVWVEPNGNRFALLQVP